MTNAPLPQFAVDAASYQRLRPLMRRLAHDEDVARLARGLALSDGFAFHLVSCETPQIAQALLLCLAAEVPQLRGAPVKISRLVPTRAPDEPLESWALGREFFDRVFIPDPEPRIVCLDATDSRSDDRDAWLWLLQRLNERRNHLYALGAPLVFLFPFDLAIELTRFAPDLWSIRGLGLKLRDEQRRTIDDDEMPREIHQPDAPVRHAPQAELSSSISTLLQQHGPFAKRALVVEFRRLAESLHERGETAYALELLNQKILPHLKASNAKLCAELLLDTVETLVRIEQPELAEQLARRDVLPALDGPDRQTTAALLLSRIADAYRIRGDNKKALAILEDEALPRLDGLAEPEIRAELQSKAVMSLIGSGELERATELISDRQLPLEQWLPPRVAAYMFLALAEAFRDRGEPHSAAEVLRRHVLPLCTHDFDPTIEALAWVTLGQAQRDRGELREAILVWRDKAAPLYRRMGKASDWAMVQAFVARALLDLGQQEDGLRLLEEAAGTWGKWSVTTTREALTRRDALLQIARVFASNGEAERAKRLLREAIHSAALWSGDREALEQFLTELEGRASVPQPRDLQLRTQAGPEVFADAEPQTKRSSDS